MTERPILFSGPMVRAIMAGTKTQTRRVMKPQPINVRPGSYWDIYKAKEKTNTGLWTTWTKEHNLDNSQPGRQWRCPYGVAGDRLWVRESFGLILPDGVDDDGKEDQAEPGGWRPYRAEECNVEYRADAREDENPGEWPKATKTEPADPESPRWKPSIHMPRFASRITLEIAGVRVERIQEISEEDANAEGALPDVGSRFKNDGAFPGLTYREGFCTLWDSINSKRGYGWTANPWVWVIEFRRLEAVKHG